MISQFKTGYHVSYCSDNYRSRFDPAFFIELTSNEDFSSLFLHKSLKIVVWNSHSLDQIPFFNLLPKLKKQKNIFHIAYNQSVSTQLEEYDINHFFLPNFLKQFYPTSDKHINANTKNAIFLDLPSSTSEHLDTYLKIIKKYPNLLFFIQHTVNKAYPTLVEKKNVRPLFLLDPAQDLPDVTFLAINLEANASPATYSLGANGINTINNEGTPYSLDYTDLVSVYDLIDSELNRQDKEVDYMEEDLIEYRDIDFYQIPYKNHRKITWVRIEDDKFKVIEKGESSGIYIQKYMMKGNLYIIRVRGYYEGEGEVSLWIARENYFRKNQKDTILLSEENSLTDREDNTLHYLFHNEEIDDNYYIGLRFQDAPVGSCFYLKSFDIVQVN